jgi:hypothetical protein
MKSTLQKCAMPIGGFLPDLGALPPVDEDEDFKLM